MKPRAHSDPSNPVVRRVVLLVSFAVFGITVLSCRPQSVPSGGGGAARQPVDFAFAGVDGQVIADENTAGRVTVLLFATTFDLDSQAQAKLLEDLYRTHAPRLNAVLIFLEAPQYVDLARSFRDVLRLSYPVALANQEEVETMPRLPKVRAVPTWIVLDRSSRARGHHEGALASEGLQELVEFAE